MKIPYAVFIPLLFASACSNDSAPADGKDTTKKDSVTAIVEAPESNSTLPSPLSVAAMFKSSGLKFLPGMTNTPEKSAAYSTTFACAENMGVYSSDMAYCVMNKQTNDAQRLLKTIREMGNKINLGKVFDQSSLYDRFNANLDNEDSLGSIIAEIQYQTNGQLEQNQQTELYGVIYAGAWVEAMYIGGQVYQKDGNDKLVPALLQQMAVSKSIIEELKLNAAKDPAIPALISDMEDIQAAIDAVPSMKKLQNDENFDFKNIHPDKAELAPVIKKVEALRSKIING